MQIEVSDFLKQHFIDSCIYRFVHSCIHSFIHSLVYSCACFLQVYVEGQSRVEVRSMAEMEGIIFAAIENRMVRSTNMNADSSRSHLIFTIEFTQNQISEHTGRQTNAFSKLNLVDLAGSERARTTGTSGDGLREGANINRSL